MSFFRILNNFKKIKFYVIIYKIHKYLLTWKTNKFYQIKRRNPTKNYNLFIFYMYLPEEFDEKRCELHIRTSSTHYAVNVVYLSLTIPTCCGNCSEETSALYINSGDVSRRFESPQSGYTAKPRAPFTDECVLCLFHFLYCYFQIFERGTCSICFLPSSTFRWTCIRLRFTGKQKASHQLRQRLPHLHELCWSHDFLTNQININGCGVAKWILFKFNGLKLLRF